MERVDCQHTTLLAKYHQTHLTFREQLLCQSWKKQHYKNCSATTEVVTTQIIFCDLFDWYIAYLT